MGQAAGQLFLEQSISLFCAAILYVFRHHQVALAVSVLAVFQILGSK